MTLKWPSVCWSAIKELTHLLMAAYESVTLGFRSDLVCKIARCCLLTTFSYVVVLVCTDETGSQCRSLSVSGDVFGFWKATVSSAHLFYITLFTVARAQDLALLLCVVCIASCAQISCRWWCPVFVRQSSCQRDWRQKEWDISHSLIFLWCIICAWCM